MKKTLTETRNDYRQKQAHFFFGEGKSKQITNNYIEYDPIIDEENIIIRTNNIVQLKGNLVLLVDNNKGVYLKDWQVVSSSNHELGLEFDLVKLNKKYFKAYEFKFDFEQFAFTEEDTFDKLLEIAKSQKNENIIIKW